MAKSPRTGQGRGRRRPAAEPAATPEPTAEEAATPGTAVTPGTADAYRRVSAMVESAGRNGPTREQIAKRAYEIYIERGGTHGYDIEDWLQAERELRGQ